MILDRSRLTSAGEPAGQPLRLPLSLGGDGGAGRSVEAQLQVCANPACPCAEVQVSCVPIPETAPSPGAVLALPEPIEFGLDVLRRVAVTVPDSSKEASTLSLAIAEVLEAPDWDALREYFLASKRRLMETMDLDTVDAHLPPEVMDGEGTMVGYREVFPWAPLLEFSLEGAKWLADDQHCVAPGCTCTCTNLSFYRLSGGRSLLRFYARLRYDYQSGSHETLRTRPRTPAPEELIDRLRAAHPGLDQVFRKRHDDLQHLGRRLLPESVKRLFGSFPGSNTFGPQPLRLPPRSGRNDPCPCGSGKKFKKCCGAS